MTWFSLFGALFKWLLQWGPVIFGYLKGRMDQRAAGKSATLKARERQLEKANNHPRTLRGLARRVRERRGW